MRAPLFDHLNELIVPHFKFLFILLFNSIHLVSVDHLMYAGCGSCASQIKKLVLGFSHLDYKQRQIPKFCSANTTADESKSAFMKIETTKNSYAICSRIPMMSVEEEFLHHNLNHHHKNEIASDS